MKMKQLMENPIYTFGVASALPGTKILLKMVGFALEKWVQVKKTEYLRETL
jgi:hypothetical protein